MAADFSCMNWPPEFLEQMRSRMESAFEDMNKLEQGAIANPDENRRVGHYWLRDAGVAPDATIRESIEENIKNIKRFAAEVHSGDRSANGKRFENVLLIGIGGSALGPQFVAHALGYPGRDKMRLYFFDNTDPDGMDRVLAAIDELEKTLCIVISKSGGTKETRNGMLEAKAAFEKRGLDFSKHAVAITQADSELDRLAAEAGWIQRFPLWEWVGGRTSELSSVGLLPAALQGIDIQALLDGAQACDVITRREVVEDNPAAMMALAWYYAGNGKGKRNLAVLPYKDRLELFSKYLQQLIMESLGKEWDLNGKIVNQGLTVFGNKGSTDQHSFVQQLRDGMDNFIVIFVESLKDREGESIRFPDELTSGDYLQGFLLGTRQALREKGRQSITITVDAVTPKTIGALIALFERAVGFYASLIRVNAYHQPGVEAGKTAAASVLGIKKQILKFLQANGGQSFTAEQIAKAITPDAETVFLICRRLAENEEFKVKSTDISDPTQARFQT